MQHPLPFPLLLLSPCFTLPQFKSFTGFVPQRIKFVSPPVANTTPQGTNRWYANHIKRYRADLGPGLQLTSGCKARFRSAYQCGTQLLAVFWHLVTEGPFMWKQRVFLCANARQDKGLYDPFL